MVISLLTPSECVASLGDSVIVIGSEVGSLSKSESVKIYWLSVKFDQFE